MGYIFFNFSSIKTEPRIPTAARGRLTERLLAQGLLTPAMLEELRKEWDQQSAAEPAEGDRDPLNSMKSRRKRKK